MFNALVSLGVVEDAVVADLYAGCGALGIEALSRGAEQCTFVERDSQALRFLRANLEKLGIADRSRIVPTDVSAVGSVVDGCRPGPRRPAVHLRRLADPLGHLATAGVGFVVAESDREVEAPDGWETCARSGTAAPGSPSSNEYRDGTHGRTSTVLTPGSFDPIHLGHLDVVEQAAELFGSVIVAVMHNPSKPSGLFTIDERVEMVRAAIAHVDGATVQAFPGLAVDAAKAAGADFIVKGLRTPADFEVEQQMALTNHSVSGVRTVYLPCRPDLSFVSSRSSERSRSTVETFPISCHGRWPINSRTSSRPEGRPHELRRLRRLRRRGLRRRVHRPGDAPAWWSRRARPRQPAVHR